MLIHWISALATQAFVDTPGSEKDSGFRGGQEQPPPVESRSIRRPGRRQAAGSFSPSLSLSRLLLAPKRTPCGTLGR
jgi:hypothetical protein